MFNNVEKIYPRSNYCSILSIFTRENLLIVKWRCIHYKTCCLCDSRTVLVVTMNGFPLVCAVAEGRDAADDGVAGEA